jgi:thiol-disulfide isomerase/thioredoxin
MNQRAVRAGARGAFLVLWVILLPVLGCSAQEGGDSGASASEADSEKPKRPAPRFQLKGVDGRPIALAEHRGKPVVIDFWATWCVPCIYQVPELNAFWEIHRAANDVAVIGVAVDVEGASVVAPWIEEKGVEYQIAIGDEGLAREFGVMGFPTLAIINSDGNIESLHVGLIEVEELERLVAPLLGSSEAQEPAL